MSRAKGKLVAGQSVWQAKVEQPPTRMPACEPRGSWRPSLACIVGGTDLPLVSRWGGWVHAT